MAGPFQPPFVMDEVAYQAKRKELKEEIQAQIKATGRQYTMDDIRYEIDGAGAVAYSTEFSKICTAAIRGDWEPAKARCREERTVNGETVARELMRSYQRAVRKRQQTIDEADRRFSRYKSER